MMEFAYMYPVSQGEGTIVHVDCGDERADDHLHFFGDLYRVYRAGESGALPRPTAPCSVR